MPETAKGILQKANQEVQNRFLWKKEIIDILYILAIRFDIHAFVVVPKVGRIDNSKRKCYT